MKIKNGISLLISVLLLTLAACKKDEPTPKGEFSTGVLVVNEGNFGNSDGSLSFYNTTTRVVQQNIFGLKNKGLALGDVVQSVRVESNLAFIVVNNSNKMVVTDANTMVSQYTITGLSLPRYFTTLNGKGYLTEWINFSDTGRVAVINLESKKVETTIATDFGAEDIIATNGKLYVSNNFSNTISVIDPLQNTVVHQFIVGSAPGAFALDKDNRIWVICGGGYDAQFNPLNDGALYRINSSGDGSDKSIPLSRNLVPKLAINKTRDKFYFFDSKNIYRVNITDTSFPGTGFIAEPTAVDFYGIGVDPLTDILYVGDSKAFVSSGIVYRYNSDGTAIDNFTAGRGPNGFVFR